ncbi:MAG: ADP-glyceromanno-heptose 6-epimerase [Chthoniobacterales bacterium]
MNTRPLDHGKILVTGGAGFIGSALVWALNQRGLENIVICDILGSDEKWRNLVPLRYLDYVEAADVKSLIETKAAPLRGVETIFHLGACSATTEKDASYLIRNNFEFTKLLAGWALENEARFVYASSAATYGDGAQGMNDLDTNLTRLRPLNMYGYSKHLFDVYAQKHGFLDQIVGLKYFNVFGPNEWHKGDMRSLVNKAYDQVRATGRLQLFRSHHSEYRDGEQMRDFLYVKDAVEMTIHLAETSSAGGLFNLGSGEANTWLTLANSLFSAMELEPKIDFIDMPESIRPNYQYYTKASIEKLRGTGYESTVTPLTEAVTDYTKNYLIPRRHLGA